jgi:hypothetical protein
MIQDPRWLLLIHQIPPKPDYLRVKIWRRLQRVGALPVKNSVYVLPESDRAREDFEWIVREIGAQGGDATVCEARFVDGLSDGDVVGMFHTARGDEYAAITSSANELRAAVGKAREARRAEIAGEAARLRRRFEEVVDIDFLSAPGREAADAALRALQSALVPEAKPPPAPAEGKLRREDHQGRTWVTRKGIHVDRMGSAWLIRRFIDPRARFKYVAPKGYKPRPRELRFDMFDAELTHEGSACSFEVICTRFGLDGDAGLRTLGKIIHELDVRDGQFDLPEIAGVGALINGIALVHRDDDERLARASAVLDVLYELFRRRKD